MRMFNNMILFFLTVFFLSHGSCSSENNRETDSYQYSVPDQTTDGWVTGSLSEVELEEGPFIQMMNHINGTHDHGIHSILLVKNSKLVFEEYFNGFQYVSNPPGSDGEYILYNREELHYLASVTKSVTSVLTGIAVNKGFVTDMNDQIVKYLPQYADILTGIKAGITLKHLITMSAGLAWDETTYPYGDINNDVTRLFISADPIRFVLEKPLLTTPGTTFFYNSGATNVLAEIIEETTGKDLGTFAGEFLFNPLGIENFNWEKFNSGDFFASGGLWLNPRDLAKIGFLFINDGAWNGQQIISQNWITESQQASISTPTMSFAGSYGYQWWIREFNTNNRTFHCFFAAGWGEQLLFVFPQHNMLILFNCGYFLTPVVLSPYNLVADYILKSIPGL
ncbi:MAG: serine hydrolase [Bacteroidales bacterium]|nr:MAG: serine hydrolase [Bacteroidales bacterium]